MYSNTLADFTRQTATDSLIVPDRVSLCSAAQPALFFFYINTEPWLIKTIIPLYIITADWVHSQMQFVCMSFWDILYHSFKLSVYFINIVSPHPSGRHTHPQTGSVESLDFTK